MCCNSCLRVHTVNIYVKRLEWQKCLVLELFGRFHRIGRWFSQTLSANRKIRPHGTDLSSRVRWINHGQPGVIHDGRAAWDRGEVRPKNK